jgi:3-phosphoglycerate kinase
LARSSTCNTDFACRPFVVVIGGAKVADKLGVLTELIKKADKMIVGGRMAFTFLAQKGVALGSTHVEHDLAEQAADIIKLAESSVRFRGLLCSVTILNHLLSARPTLEHYSPGTLRVHTS